MSSAHSTTNDRRIWEGPDRVFRDYEIKSAWERKTGKTAIIHASIPSVSGGVNGWGWGGQGQYKHCTHKGRKVFTLGAVGDPQITLWAVQSAQIRNIAAELDLWIPLNGFSVSDQGFAVGQRPANAILGALWDLLSKPVGPPTLRLDWPDRGIPPVHPETLWPALLTTVQGMAKEKADRLLSEGKETTPLHVAFSCVGAHGRTGTALAALLVLVGLTGQAATTLVRSTHCEEAIEGKLQEEYILKIDELLTKMPMAIAYHPKPESPAALAEEKKA